MVYYKKNTYSSTYFIGDPTVFGNLKPSKNVQDALIRVINEGKHNGYAHSWGHPQARKVIAKKFTYNDTTAKLTENVFNSLYLERKKKLTFLGCRNM